MMHRIGFRALIGLATVATCAGLAPATWAASTPAVSLDQSAGTGAGTTRALGMNLTFASSPSTDSVKDLTLSLPPGLLANASIDGGACLSAATPTAACQVGSGTVTATPFVPPLNLPGPRTNVAVTFDLVRPPAPSDLAGLAIMATNPVTHAVSQLGSPGEITVLPSGALNIAFHNVPDTYALLGPATVPISVDAITSTFAGLRLPTRCPSPAAAFGVQTDSYADATTRTAAAPLQVTGCHGLSFAPLLKVTATKDSADNGVALVTDVTQTATQATSARTALGFPSAVVSPNAAAVISGGLICTSPSFTGCPTIGSADATSPLYPRTLVGRVFLTGSLAAPAITITFPAPFALTLNGTVSLATNTTTFSGVPDIPLSDLRVSLAGGHDAAFATTCATPSGTATGSFTSQDGDLVATSTAPFAVVGCPGVTGGGTGGGGAGGTGGGGGVAGGGPTADLGLPSLASATLSGLRRGRPVLSFTLTAGRGAPKLTGFTLPLPRGLAVIRHRARHRLVLRGITVRNARVKSIRLVHGRLVVTLRRGTARLQVRLSSRALRESRALRAKARRHHVRYLTLTVRARTAAHRQVTLTRAVRPRN